MREQDFLKGLQLLSDHTKVGISRHGGERTSPARIGESRARCASQEFPSSSNCFLRAADETGELVRLHAAGTAWKLYLPSMGHPI